jgi:hypothetical protein
MWAHAQMQVKNGTGSDAIIGMHTGNSKLAQLLVISLNRENEHELQLSLHHTNRERQDKMLQGATELFAHGTVNP